MYAFWLLFNSKIWSRWMELTFPGPRNAVYKIRAFHLDIDFFYTKGNFKMAIMCLQQRQRRRRRQRGNQTRRRLNVSSIAKSYLQDLQQGALQKVEGDVSKASAQQSNSFENCQAWKKGQVKRYISGSDHFLENSFSSTHKAE